MSSSDREIAFADPADVDLAVPASPATLPDIMAKYPLSWERAGNGPYMDARGRLLGTAAERHNIYRDHGILAVTCRWPVLYVEGETPESARASFGEVMQARTREALCALSAGPMLVSRGGILDIPSRIAQGGYEGFDASTRKPQRAIGISASGELADGIWKSATLYEVAENLLEAGCIEAMKLDSGGSSGVVEWREPIMGLAWGFEDRLLAAAIVFRKVKRWWRPRTSILPKVDLDLDFSRLLTPNFRMNEFQCKCGCGAVSVSRDFAELAARLQMLRDAVGRPVNVTSGYRCARHDAAVGTSSSPGCGPHTTGTAADLWIDGMGVDEMAEQAKAAGFSGVGRYPGQGFVHVDLRQPASDFVGDKE